MQELWNMVENQSRFVYFIAGVCIVGILCRLILQGRFRRLLKESENMTSATGKQLREIRNHYENSLTMNRQVYNIHAYVDKYLLKLKLCGIPIRTWAGMTMEMALLAVAGGGLGIVNSIHRGYGEEVIFSILFATIISCACLISMENIFRVEGSYDRLQANIEDYLENNLKNRLERPISSRQERLRRTQTGDAGRGDTRPVNGSAEPAPLAEQAIGVRQAVARRQAAEQIAAADCPQEEPSGISQKGTGQAGWQQKELSSEEAQPVEAMEQAAAGQDAELVAQVLRNFFSS